MGRKTVVAILIIAGLFVGGIELFSPEIAQSELFARAKEVWMLGALAYAVFSVLAMYFGKK